MFYTLHIVLGSIYQHLDCYCVLVDKSYTILNGRYERIHQHIYTFNNDYVKFVGNNIEKRLYSIIRLSLITN